MFKIKAPIMASGEWQTEINEESKINKTNVIFASGTDDISHHI